MALSLTTLPPAHPLAALAVQFGMPLDNRHGFQAAIEKWLGATTPKERPKVPSKGKKVAWKSFGPMRSGSCGQCGESADHRSGSLGGHSALCSRCFAVLEKSRAHWVANDDFPAAG